MHADCLNFNMSLYTSPSCRIKGLGLAIETRSLLNIHAVILPNGMHIPIDHLIRFHCKFPVSVLARF